MTTLLQTMKRLMTVLERKEAPLDQATTSEWASRQAVGASATT